MQAGARRGRPGHDLESVLRGAVKVFNERGYDGTSMEDLSRELGITKSAIYHHVPGKEELLRLAVNRALDGLFALLDEISVIDAPAMARPVPLHHRVDHSVQQPGDQGRVDVWPEVALVPGLGHQARDGRVELAAPGERLALGPGVPPHPQQQGDEGQFRHQQEHAAAG